MNKSKPDAALPEPSTDGSMVVHTRARALLEWLVPQVAQWPREHRHTLARHTVDLAMQVHDALVAARHLDAATRPHALRDADITLDPLRQYLQLAWRWQWLSPGQYQHVCGLTDELGRMVGGWRRGGARSDASTDARPDTKKEATPG